MSIKNKKAFTLIELLVVVLIIGILSAVALPQYQAAVVKAKAATMLAFAKNLLEAEEVYYLANGFYTGSVSDLDIGMPAECSHINFPQYDSSNTGELLKCKNDFLVDNAAHVNRVGVHYCPGKNTTWDECSHARHFMIGFVGPRGTEENGKRKNKRFCQPLNNSSLGKRICSNFGGLEEWE